MTKGELLDMLVRNAKEYRKGWRDSLWSNAHMHDASVTDVGGTPDAMADAILTDFINDVAMRQGCDLALYARDLREN